MSLLQTRLDKEGANKEIGKRKMDMISNNFMQKNKKIKDKNSNRLCKDTMSVPYNKTEVQLTRNKQQNTIKKQMQRNEKNCICCFSFLCFVVGLLPSSSLTQMQQWEKFALLAGRSWEVPTTSNQPSRRPWAPLVKCQ